MGKLIDLISNIFKDDRSEQEKYRNNLRLRAFLNMDDGNPTEKQAETFADSKENEISEVTANNEDSEDDTMTTPPIVVQTNCLSCKVTSTATLLGGATLIMACTREKWTTYRGRKLVFFRVQCAFMASALVLVAVARALEIGFFKPTNKDKNIEDIINEEKIEFITSVKKTYDNFTKLFDKK